MLITKIHKRSIQRQNRQTGLTQSQAGETPLPAAKSICPTQTQFCFTCCSSPAWWPSAERQDPIPSRTRPSNAPAPMVLCLKTWESRSSPGLQRTELPSLHRIPKRPRAQPAGAFAFGTSQRPKTQRAGRLRGGGEPSLSTPPCYMSSLVGVNRPA